MSWFEKLIPARIRTDAGEKRKVPEGLWYNCASCNAVLYRAELERNLNVCPKCEYHIPIYGRERLSLFLDQEGPQVEIGAEVKPVDVLKFKDTTKYKDRLSAAQKKTDENDALIVMQAEVMKVHLVAAAFDFKFMGGSMGAVVGEKFVRAVDVCIKQRIPLVSFAASGGARMQEALFSLMQMAKTSAAIERLKKEKIPFISILTHPTTGGVSASFAMLGDVILAEPRALIGFAGPKVIEQTVRETLPEGFQRSEFLLEHGAIDRIVDRRQMRIEVATMLSILQNLPPVSAETASVDDVIVPAPDEMPLDMTVEIEVDPDIDFETGPEEKPEAEE